MRILTNLIINVRLWAGTTITDACEELCLLANLLQAPVKTKFNGIDLFVSVGASPFKLEQAYVTEFDRRYPPGIAIV